MKVSLCFLALVTFSLAAVVPQISFADGPRLRTNRSRTGGVTFGEAVSKPHLREFTERMTPDQRVEFLNKARNAKSAPEAIEKLQNAALELAKPDLSEQSRAKAVESYADGLHRVAEGFEINPEALRQGTLEFGGEGRKFNSAFSDVAVPVAAIIPRMDALQALRGLNPKLRKLIIETVERTSQAPQDSTVIVREATALAKLVYSLREGTPLLENGRQVPLKFEGEAASSAAAKVESLLEGATALAGSGSTAGAEILRAMRLVEQYLKEGGEAARALDGMERLQKIQMDGILSDLLAVKEGKNSELAAPEAEALRKAFSDVSLEGKPVAELMRELEAKAEALEAEGKEVEARDLRQAIDKLTERAILRMVEELERLVKEGKISRQQLIDFMCGTKEQAPCPVGVTRHRPREALTRSLGAKCGMSLAIWATAGVAGAAAVGGATTNANEVNTAVTNPAHQTTPTTAPKTQRPRAQ